MNRSEVVVAASTGALVAPARQGPDPGPLTLERIYAGLGSIALAGYTAVELSDIWLHAGTASSAELRCVARALADQKLELVGLSSLGVESAEQALPVAVTLGARVLCVGLHTIRRDRPPNISFWAHSPSRIAERDEEESLTVAARAMRRLCDRAERENIRVVIEMNESSIVDRASRVLRLLDVTDSSNLSVNPDLGNLTRQSIPLVEPWYETLAALAPYATYWQVKNNYRLEHPQGFVATHPCSLEEGIIDYRVALEVLFNAGFAGPIVVESYFGDRIGELERARAYLVSLLQRSDDLRAIAESFRTDAEGSAGGVDAPRS